MYPDFGDNSRVEMRKWFWNFEEGGESYLDGYRKAGLEIPDEPEDDGFRKEPASGG